MLYQTELQRQIDWGSYRLPKVLVFNLAVFAPASSASTRSLYDISYQLSWSGWSDLNRRSLSSKDSEDSAPPHRDKLKGSSTTFRARPTVHSGSPIILVRFVGLEPTPKAPHEPMFYLNYHLILGSAGWIRTSNLDLNRVLRYHCATTEYLADKTGFEPAISPVTGECANHYATYPYC